MEPEGQGPPPAQRYVKQKYPKRWLKNMVDMTESLVPNEFVGSSPLKMKNSSYPRLPTTAQFLRPSYFVKLMSKASSMTLNTTRNSEVSPGLQMRSPNLTSGTQFKCGYQPANSPPRHEWLEYTRSPDSLIQGQGLKRPNQNNAPMLSCIVPRVTRLIVSLCLF